MTGVKEIYRISERVHAIAGWRVSSIFLFLNTLLWSVLALVIGMAFLCLTAGTAAGHGTTLFCLVGYAGTIIGFFGGMYYLYRKDD